MPLLGRSTPSLVGGRETPIGTHVLPFSASPERPRKCRSGRHFFWIGGTPARRVLSSEEEFSHGKRPPERQGSCPNPHSNSSRPFACSAPSSTPPTARRWPTPPKIGRAHV